VVVIDAPSSFHMETPWQTWKNVLICWIISSACFPLLNDWYSVSVLGD